MIWVTNQRALAKADVAVGESNDLLGLELSINRGGLGRSDLTLALALIALHIGLAE